jgi:hypothetical protein
VRWQKRLFGFCLKGFACAVGAKANVPFAGRHKIELKKCAMGKIKSTEGSAMSVGLLVARLKYDLYVGHLSKWFTFFSFKFVSVCYVVSFYACW